MLATTIKNPIRYKTPDLSEGEKAVVYILQPKQCFVNLKFQESDGIQYKPNLIIGDSDSSCFQKNSKTRKKLEEIEKRIVSLGSVYTCYSYLFTVKGNEVYLISMALETVTLGFDMVSVISKEIGVSALKPSWIGTYTQAAVTAFFEDIFIQRK